MKFLTGLVLVLSLGADLAHAEAITVQVNAQADAGTLPTFFEPSIFSAFSPIPMKLDFIADSKRTRGVFIEETLYELGSATSLNDYKTRLQNSGLATQAKALANQGGLMIVLIQGMPTWLSSSNVTTKPPGCEGEWPTFQTKAPDPTKWADWEAAINATVTHFNVTNSLSNVWFLFWGEADGPCFWTDTQAKYLETWQHFATAARAADPNVRLGGPAPVGGPSSIKPGETVPLMQAFVEYSAQHNIAFDFLAYHTFESPPEAARIRNRAVLKLLSDNGLPPKPIVVSSWNPNQACFEPNAMKDDPTWPSPPSALGCWQPDTEMGASYSLAFMWHLASEGATGYQAMYSLDDADIGTDEFPHDWGLRTNSNKHGLRKAIYHAHTIVGWLPRSLRRVTLTHANGMHEYFPHLYALAGAEGDRLSILAWSYVTSPGQQARSIMSDLGYTTADVQRWGGVQKLYDFVSGTISVSTLTSVTQEQTDLQTMKNAALRQQVLAQEDSAVTLDISGFPSTGGYRVTRSLIDATHNNSYATFTSSGLNAAVAQQHLQILDTTIVPTIGQVQSVALKPFSVELIEIERLAGDGGVVLIDAGVTGNDSGVQNDGGETSDSGTPSDAGAPTDAGPLMADAGNELDAGAPDAGGLDGGITDEPPTPGCGCQSFHPSLMVLSALWVLRRTRTRRLSGRALRSAARPGQT